MLSISESNGMTAYRAGSNAPPSALYRGRPAFPAPRFVSNTPVGLVTWTDNGAGGTFVISGASQQFADYTPPNKTQNVTVTATDDANSLSLPISIYGTLPVYPQLGYEIELDVDTKTKKARDGTQYHREDGLPEIGWAFAWDNRQDDERSEMMEFWMKHRRIKPFYLIDVEGEIINLVKFTSSLKSAPNGANRWAMGASFRGFYSPIDLAPPSAPTLLSVISYGSSSLTAFWSAAIDNVGVTGYKVEIDGTSVFDAGNVFSFTYSAFGPYSGHSFRVQAYDAAGNYSDWSNSMVGFCQAPCPPIILSGSTVDSSTVSLTIYEPDEVCMEIPPSGDDYLLLL